MDQKFKSGCWSYLEDRALLAFNPAIEDSMPEMPEYGVSLYQLTSSAKLLDMILQMQRKGRWSERGEEARNNYGRWHCDDYQVWDFIQVVDSLCKHYMGTTVQGVFSAWGNDHEVDWDKLVSKKK